MNNYVAYHVHTELSLLDSTTKCEDYIKKAIELGQRAIGFSEHGNIYNWTYKKFLCEKYGLKYLHCCEIYLTEKLYFQNDNGENEKIRDNYHTILIAKNLDGLKEMNRVISRATDEDHFYYKPRVTFEEFLSLSDNVIKISACLASPLNEYRKNQDKAGNELFLKLFEKYDYYEIQPHVNSDEQKEYNKWLYEKSLEYHKPLIAATDTHSLNTYKAECRSILQRAKGIQFANEDTFDLTYKSYDELVDCFKKQNSLTDDIFLNAIENTNVMCDSVEEIKLDLSIKYPHLYDNDDEVYYKRIYDMFKDKLDRGVIPKSQEETFRQNIEEEVRVFRKVDMMGFMLSMSDICMWARNNGHPLGMARGSCGGSSVAYITDITDINPVTWNLVFSRFCNEDRKEIGDIDIDCYKDDRPYIYDYIINRVGKDKTAYVLAIGTVSDKGTIDEIGRALSNKWEYENRQGENPYSLDKIAKVKSEYTESPSKAREKYPDIFYYFDGLVNTAISQSQHPAGIIAAPITLDDNYGTFYGRENQIILSLDMEAIHEVGLAKYDILGLRNVGLIKKTYEFLGKPYPKSNEIDWNDQDVWKSIAVSNIGIFQFESDYAFKVLKDFNTKSIDDMSLVTAMIRPSGASYRDNLCKHIINHNPSEIIDDLLKNNLGYLVYQEDVIAFLQQICGLTGSEADNVRRAIGRKDEERLQKALPQILEGYCNKSTKDRLVAEQEAKTFLQIIEDASSYMFGKNHSYAYCLLGYLCGYLRHYYPYEFLTAFFNCSETEEDISNGTKLAGLLNINIKKPLFRYSKSEYFYDKESKSIYKGIKSVKYLNENVAEILYSFKDNKYNSFVELLYDISKTSINSRQMGVLIDIDFFEEFGNAKQLALIYNIFNMFKQGNAKLIKKERLSNNPILNNIVARYSKETATNYTQLDCKNILSEAEQYIMCSITDDYPIGYKIKVRKEYLGYIDYKTNKPEDRPKILIQSLKKCIGKFGKDAGKPWCYMFDGYSLGSGKVSTYSIFAKQFEKNSFAVDDVIYIDEWHRNNKGYFYIDKYKILPKI